MSRIGKILEQIGELPNKVPYEEPQEDQQKPKRKWPRRLLGIAGLTSAALLAYKAAQGELGPYHRDYAIPRYYLPR